MVGGADPNRTCGRHLPAIVFATLSADDQASIGVSLFLRRIGCELLGPCRDFLLHSGEDLWGYDRRVGIGSGVLWELAVIGAYTA